MSHQEHEQAAQSLPPLRVALYVVSDSRDAHSDRSGRHLFEALETSGHRPDPVRFLPNEEPLVRATLRDALSGHHWDAHLVSGGTGLSRRDRTVEAVRPLLEREIPGFGELFRSLSYAEIGPSAMLSRALAGSAQGQLVVLLPGSTAAVSLALERLLLPSFRHLIREIRR